MAVSKKLEKAAMAISAKKDADYEDLDEWENIDSSIVSPPVRASSKQQPIVGGGGGSPSNNSSMINGAAPMKNTPSGGSPVIGGGRGERLTSRPSTGSISSEGFATPPPSLPSRSHMQPPSPRPSGGDEPSGDHTHRNSGESLLARHVSEMTDDEIEKLVNTPITLPQNGQPQVAVVSNARPQKIPALPSEMRSWKFKAAADPESDDDNDFVDSTELQEMLLANQQEKQSSVTATQASEAATTNKRTSSSRSPTPPPLPPREYTMSNMRKSTTTAQDETDGERDQGGDAATSEEAKVPVATVVGQLSKQTVVPPLHVRHVTGMGVGLLYSEHDVDGDRERGARKDSTLKREDQRAASASWLYSDDLVVDEAGDSPGKGQSTNVNGIDSLDDELYSTVQRTQLKGKPKGGHDYDTLSAAFDSQRGNPVISGGNDNDDNTISTDQVTLQILPENTTTVKAKPSSPGADYDHLQEIDPQDIQQFEAMRRISSSVDRESRRTTNGISSLSLPLTVDEQSKFQSSIMSDDVFNDSAVTPVESEPSSRRDERQRRELGASEAPSLNPDDIDVGIQSDDEEEQDKRSVTTEMELSSVTSVSESLMRDGTVTPVQMTLNASVVNMMRYRVSQTPEQGSGSGTAGEEEEENELLDSAEYSSLPEEDGEIDGDGEGAGSKSSTRTDMTEITYEDLGRPRTKSWITKTIRKTAVCLASLDLCISMYYAKNFCFIATSTRCSPLEFTDACLVLD
jgi:hypothetical protein